MATVDNLDNTSILEMSNEDLLNHLQEIRRLRRTSKKKFAKNKRPKKEKSAESLVNGLSPEQAAQLLAKLEG